jgi:[acyl-carrier-protein] S-malonyltransferase
VVAAVGRPTELVMANDNAPGQVVISGTREALAAAEEPMKVAGARRVIALPVSGAFHSPLMAGVAGALREAFESEAWTDAQVPVVSNVTAEPTTDGARIRALLAEQVRSPVEWVRSVERMRDDAVGTMIELGSGAALVGMVKRIAPGVRAHAVHDSATLDAAVELLGVPVEASAS